MRKIITKFKRRAWKDLTDKELCELALLAGISLTGLAEEIESAKYLIKDRKGIIELLEKRWAELLSEESLIISRRALWISIICAATSVASVVIHFL